MRMKAFYNHIISGWSSQLAKLVVYIVLYLLCCRGQSTSTVADICGTNIVIKTHSDSGGNCIICHYSNAAGDKHITFSTCAICC